MTTTLWPGGPPGPGDGDTDGGTEVVVPEVLGPEGVPGGLIPAGVPAPVPAERPPAPVTPRRIVVGLLVWLVVTSVAIGLVVYGVGPMLQQRDQRGLLSDYRTEIRQAANEKVSFVVEDDAPEAPMPGDGVAILDIGDIHVEQVVVEGVGPQQTRTGPGHVPGTAGPGQPGNSAVVARRSAFGAAFTDLAGLERGDRIVVTTTQGQTVYEVVEVRQARLRDEAPAGAAAPATTTTSTTSTTAPERDREPDRGAAKEQVDEPEEALPATLLPSGELTLDDVYGPSPDDRLTLVTSASRAPWATERATVAVAVMRGDPFEPTPQNGRTAEADGRSRDGGAAAPLALAAVAYGLAVGAAIVLYRQARPRSAYLLTAPPLLAATVLTAEAAARMLPAWF